ncbi:hypothetical protein L1987_42944 [Smallanthus sonchifolius]|uniref:Uncharacterized protein n=1 Tax=Smallanthus sonchifolius TaxID=185202 RepID=A0ACB9GL84_9ASTR|nr:hypothetical protein L1987_42944 [Smallanthus sonchifolius]
MSDPVDTNPALTQQIVDRIAAILPALFQHRDQSSSNNNNNNACNFKYFNSCSPPKYSGHEGATGLLQWFEGIENTFFNAGVPEALKIEEEFWTLSQDSGDNSAYVTRFYELCLLVPHLVDTLARKIEKFCKGLPIQIRSAVLSSRPATIEEAVRLSATLTDTYVDAGILHRKGEKKPAVVAAVTSRPEPTGRNRKRKSNHKQNYGTVTPAQPVSQVAPATTTTTFMSHPDRWRNHRGGQCDDCSKAHDN